MDPNDPGFALYVVPPPPLRPNYGNMQLPYEVATDHMNTPIVISLLLSAFLFILFLGFYLSPACLDKERPPKPIDLEDAYFTDENHKHRFPSQPLPFSNTYSGDGKDAPKKSLYHPKNTYFSFTPPPPTYTSRPHLHNNSSEDSSFTSLLCRANTSFASPVHKPRFFSMPKILSRRASPISISKPIPHPEGPLPGPDVLTESEALSQVSDTTFIRPCIAPRSVSDNILHLPTIKLPNPSRAHVYNRDTFFTLEKSSRFLSTASGRSSTSFAGIQPHESFASVTSSNIGLAF